MGAIEPVTYAEFRARMTALGFTEFDDTDVEGTRIFMRDMMGLGSPAYPMIYEGEEAVIPPPVLRFALRVLGVPLEQWERMANEAARRAAEAGG